MEEMESEVKDLDSLHDSDQFLFDLQEYNDRLNYIFDNEPDLYNLKARILDSGDTVGVAISMGSESVIVLAYDSDKKEVKSTTGQKVSNLLIIEEGEVGDLYVYSVLGTMLACDPTLNVEDAMDMLEEMSKYATNGSDEYYVHNEVTYVIAVANGMTITSCRIE